MQASESISPSPSPSSTASPSPSVSGSPSASMSPSASRSLSPSTSKSASPSKSPSVSGSRSESKSMNSVFEFTENPTFPYAFTADEKMITNDFESGGYEDVNLGPLLWEGNFGFAVHERSLESEINIFSRMYKSANLVFFENYTDPALCYICRRRTPIQVSWDSTNINSIQTMTFKEIF